MAPPSSQPANSFCFYHSLITLLQKCKLLPPLGKGFILKSFLKPKTNKTFPQALQNRSKCYYHTKISRVKQAVLDSGFSPTRAIFSLKPSGSS